MIPEKPSGERQYGSAIQKIVVLNSRYSINCKGE